MLGKDASWEIRNPPRYQILPVLTLEEQLDEYLDDVEGLEVLAKVDATINKSICCQMGGDRLAGSLTGTGSDATH